MLNNTAITRLELHRRFLYERMRYLFEHEIVDELQGKALSYEITVKVCNFIGWKSNVKFTRNYFDSNKKMT
jgi:hypothetical protein